MRRLAPPHLGSEDPVPKITVHGGPSVFPALPPVPDPSAPPSDDVPAVPITDVDVVVEAPVSKTRGRR